jgi:hypothetical protein
MDKTAVQEKRCEKTPVFVLDYDGVRVERADPTQNFRIIPVARRDFEKECDRVQADKDENSRRIPELTRQTVPYRFAPDGN